MPCVEAGTPAGIGYPCDQEMLRRLVFAGVGLAVMLAASRGSAFCRTTTSQVPAGYDPTVHGCWPQGTPLAWHGGSAPYGVASAASKQVALADAVRISDLAFSAWNDVGCPGTPGMRAYDDGPIQMLPDGSDCMSSNTCDARTHDVVVFDDTTWPHDDPANTLALTTVTYGVDDGTIFEAYTEVNTAQHAVTAQEPPPANEYDLQAILTHEAGHFFGLAHATDTKSIMYAFYRAGATKLTSDDEAGFCAIYPPGSAQPKGCACGATTGGPGGLAALAAGLLAAIAALRRRVR